MSKRKKIIQVSLSDHIRYHEQLLQAVSHTVDVLEYQAKHSETLPAQLDFHILMPNLFPCAGNGSKPILENIRPWFYHVLKSQNDLGLQFYITGPTFLEFIDQLQHHAETAKDIFTKQIDRLKEDLEPLDEKSFASSGQIRTWLSALTDAGFHQNVQRPINEFSSLFEKKLLHGIGDIPYLPSPAVFQKYHTIIDSIYRTQCEERLKFDRSKRSDADSRFHYKIDAANIGISKILQYEADTTFLLFTRTQFTLRNLSELARLDQVLPALYRLQTLDETLSDRITRLKDSVCLITTNIERMRKYTTIVDVPRNLCDRMLLVYKDIQARLFQTHETEYETMFESSYDEIRNILTNRQKLADGMDRAISTIEDGASTLATKLSKVVRLDVWEDFQLADDPVYLKLRKKMRI